MAEEGGVGAVLGPFIAQAVCGTQMALFIQKGIRYTDQIELKKVHAKTDIF